jgi:hypothetical protein
MQKSGCTRIVSFVADHSPGSPLLAMSPERAPGIALGAIPRPDEPAIDSKSVSIKGIGSESAVDELTSGCSHRTRHPGLRRSSHPQSEFLDQERDEELRI